MTEMTWLVVKSDILSIYFLYNLIMTGQKPLELREKSIQILCNLCKSRAIRLDWLMQPGWLSNSTEIFCRRLTMMEQELLESESEHHILCVDENQW